MTATCKSPREIDRMLVAGQIIARIFELVRDMAEPGVTTARIDAEVEAMILAEGCTPSFKGYHGFPASICASINEEVVHGIPKDRPLLEGDLLTVDVGVIHRRFHADAARSYPIGAVAPEVEQLARVTAASLEAGIAECRPGHRLSQVCAAIEAVGREHGYGIVEGYVGHGIGKKLHEEPRVPNYVAGLENRDLVLRVGHALAIEPMFNLGTKETDELDDRWTVVTRDGRCSAHFEDTVAITEDGPRILTRREGGPGLLLGFES